jgi:hypothetical protein
MGLTSGSRRPSSTDVVDYDIQRWTLFKYGQTKHVLSVRLCWKSTAVTPGHRINFMLSTNVSNKFALASLGWNRGGHCHGPLSAAWQADCSKRSWYSGSCSVETYTSSCKAEGLGAARHSSIGMWGRCLLVLETTNQMDWTSGADCKNWLVFGANFNGLFLREQSFSGLKVIIHFMHTEN